MTTDFEQLEPKKEAIEYLDNFYNDFFGPYIVEENEAAEERRARSELNLPKLGKTAHQWPNPEHIRRSHEAALELFEANTGAAFDACRPLKRLVSEHFELEDYEQLVLMGLWGCCLMYNEEKSTIATWIYKVCPRFVRHEINMKYMRQFKLGGHTSLEKIPIDCRPSDENPEVDRTAVTLAREVLRLNAKFNEERRARLFATYHLKSISLQELGELEGLTRERIRQLVTQAKQKIQRELGLIP